MRDYLLAQRKEEKARRKIKKKSKSKGKRQDETPEERRARKARKKEKKAKKIKSAGMKGVEDLLNTLGRPDERQPKREPKYEYDTNRRRSRSPERRHHSHSRSRSPVRNQRRVSPHGRSPSQTHENSETWSRGPVRSSKPGGDSRLPGRDGVPRSRAYDV